jgi:hypothetical protein
MVQHEHCDAGDQSSGADDRQRGERDLDALAPHCPPRFGAIMAGGPVLGNPRRKA